MDKIIIYNPKDGAEIKDIYAKKIWIHDVNCVKKYEPELARYLLKKYGFLREIEPKALPALMKEMESVYKCNFKNCHYETDDPKKLETHKLGKHKMTQEVKAIVDGVPDASSAGDVIIPDKKKMSPEQMEGIPDTSRGEKDGWYGPGWQADQVGSGMMKASKPGVTPGHFGG